MDIYGIVGAGGFGREVMPLVEEMLSVITQNAIPNVVFVVENTVETTSINGIKVISEVEFLNNESDRKFFNIAIADAKARERISVKLIAKGCQPFSVQALNSTILSKNDIDVGAIICPFVTVTSNAKIGKFFHANIYSYVAHDCVIGDYVTFAPRVCCNGNVVIEDFAYIGTGVVIKQGTPEKPIIIGKGATVGMGAVVTKSVPPYSVVVGNPAEPMKRKAQA